MLDHILVPVDGSVHSDDAVRFATELAQRLETRLTLLSVFEASDAALMGMTALTKEGVQSAIERMTAGQLDRARALARDVDAKTVAKIGNPAEEIVGFAKAENVGLIVMGARGMSAFEGLLLGSVSDRVVHHAPCAVTIIRPTDAKSKTKTE